MTFSFTTTNREILEQVVREPRFKELTRLPVWAPMEIALALGAFSLFCLGTSLYLAGHIHFLVMLVINSLAIYASFTPLHDATHRSVSSHRKLNDLIGTLCCLLLLPGITTRVYRYLHLEHHRFAGNPAKDPDELFVSASPLLLPFVLAGLDVHWSIWYFKHWRARPKGERVEFAAGLAFYIGLHVAFLTSAYALEFFLCYMIPQRFGLFYVSWFFAHIQHPEGVEWEQAPFQTTVRIVTNPIAHSLLLGQSFHCLHHLAPSVPFYRYRRAWALGEHLFERQGVPTRTLWRPSTDLGLASELRPSLLRASVASSRTVAEGVRTLELVPAGTERWPEFQAGAHIDVKLETAPGRAIIRQYSLCNSPVDRQRFQIAAKAEENGRGGSVFLHTRVEPGDTIEISAPRNNFPLRYDLTRYLLLGGGIGVTPLLAMAHELHRRELSFELHLFSANRSSLAFHQEYSAMPFADSIRIHCNDAHGQARSKLATAISPYQSGSGLYICGPTGFMAEVLNIARDNLWPSERIYSETFVSVQADSEQNTAFEVQIASTGEVFSVEPDQQLIDVLHQNGYPVMCSCTQGICGSCITPVLDGVPEHRDAIMSDEQRAANSLMTVCVSRARSERLVLDL